MDVTREVLREVLKSYWPGHCVDTGVVSPGYHRPAALHSQLSSVTESTDRLILGSPGLFSWLRGNMKRTGHDSDGFRFLDPHLPSQTCCQSDAGESFHFLTDRSKQNFHNFSSIFLQLRKFL